MQAFRDILEKQQEAHKGGSRWVGTGGTSPWGAGGKAEQGIALGNEGGNRTGIRLADARRWRDYRRDKTIGVRDMKVALRDLRHLVREGVEALDIDETIAESARNAGEIELVFGREKANRMRLATVQEGEDSRHRSGLRARGAIARAYVGGRRRAHSRRVGWSGREAARTTAARSAAGPRLVDSLLG